MGRDGWGPMGSDEPVHGSPYRLAQHSIKVSFEFLVCVSR